MRLLLTLGVLAAWLGLAFVLAALPGFRRRPLATRLAPYGSAPPTWRSSPAISLEAARDVLGPLAVTWGEAVSTGLGVPDALELRLLRAGDQRTVVDFRLHQALVGAGAFASALALVLLVAIPATPAAVLTICTTSAALLVVEQRITIRARVHQARLEAEMPVITEQLAMLIQAGFSMTGAIRRLSERANGAAAGDLAGVLHRIQQGLSVDAALQEWSASMGVDALTRLVSVCALDRDLSDIGPMLSDEARAVRRDQQRQLIESIERRNEQVWIPVTVATLIPGMVLLAIPFADALRAVSVGP